MADLAALGGADIICSTPEKFGAATLFLPSHKPGAPHLADAWACLQMR